MGRGIVVMVPKAVSCARNGRCQTRTMPEVRERRRRAIRAVLVTGFFVALTLAFFKPTVLDGETFSTVGAVQRVYLPWQVTNENGRPFFPQSDQAQSFYPRQVFVDRAVSEGVLPAWDPYTFAGHPYLSNGGNSFFYPPRQAVTWLSGPALAHDLYLMFHMALAGCAAYVLLRELRLSIVASLLGGVAWMWNPFFLSWAQLELLPPIVAWLPIALALVHRAHERASWPARLGAGAACGLMLLGGSLDLGMTACGVVGLYALALTAAGLWRTRHAPQRGRRAVKGIGRLAAIPAVAAGLGAPALLPFALLSERFARDPLPYDVFADNVTVPLSTFWQIWWHPDFPFTDATMHRMAFVGTPIALLAVIGLFQRRRGTGLARGMLLGSVLVLGRTPLVGLLDALSSSYRYLSLGRFMFAWALGLVILAAAGFDRILAVALPAPAAAEGPPRRPPSTAPARVRPPARSLVTACFVAIVLITTSAQLFRYDRAINPHFTPRTREWLFPETPALEALLARQTGPAADRNLPILRPQMQPLPDSSIPLVFPFESAAGYDSALPRSIANLWRVVEGQDIDAVQERGLPSGLITLFYTDQTRFDLLPRVGVTSVIGPNDLEGQEGWDEPGRRARGLTTVYDGPDADLMEVLEPAPRAYVVHDVERASDGDDALRRFVDPSFSWQSTVILEAGRTAADHDTGSPGTAAAGGPPEPARVTAHGLAEVRIDVDTDEAGYLVLLDSFDDGWSATVDGHDAEVVRANAAFRSVEVPAGASEVVFRYTTPGLRAALALALITLGAITVVLVVSLTRRREAARASAGIDGDGLDDGLGFGRQARSQPMVAEHDVEAQRTS